MKYAAVIIASAASALFAGSLTREATAPASAGRARTAPVRIADLPLNRAVRGVVPLAASGGTQTCQLPSGVGVALTEVGGPPSEVVGGNSFGRLTIFVDGAVVASVVLSLCGQGAHHRFDPPVIMPPGSVVALEWAPHYLFQVVGGELPRITLGGWSLLPGDI